MSSGSKGVKSAAFQPRRGEVNGKKKGGDLKGGGTKPGVAVKAK